MDRNQPGALLVQAGLGSPRDHALISLLALNGLRISEALGANLVDVGSAHATRIASDAIRVPFLEGLDRQLGRVGDRHELSSRHEFWVTLGAGGDGPLRIW